MSGVFHRVAPYFLNFMAMPVAAGVGIGLSAFGEVQSDTRIEIDGENVLERWQRDARGQDSLVMKSATTLARETFHTGMLTGMLGGMLSAMITRRYPDRLSYFGAWIAGAILTDMPMLYGIPGTWNPLFVYPSRRYLDDLRVMASQASDVSK